MQHGKQVKKDKINFKRWVEKEFEHSKNYKSELKWFDGVWSRFKPGLGKDKRGASGVDLEILKTIGNKISNVCFDIKKCSNIFQGNGFRFIDTLFKFFFPML